VAALEANNFGRTQADIVNAIMHIMEDIAPDVVP
jgi:hypothetical protein